MSKNRNPPTRKDTSTKAKKAQKAKVKPVPQQGYLEGIFYESLTEMYVLSWFLELKKEGYVKNIERSSSFLLSDSIRNDYVVQLKRGSKPMTQTIAHGHSYTPDYNVVFTKKALGVFIWDIESTTKYDKAWLVAHKVDDSSYITYTEVKPTANWRGKNTSAGNDGKWVYQKYKIFINMFKPDRFECTFTPHAYTKTGTGKARKMNYKPIFLNEFLKK